MSAFASHMAAMYYSKTISNDLNGVRMWHILHRVSWALDKREMDLGLRAADKLTPDSLRRRKRHPYMLGFMAVIGRQLNHRLGPKHLQTSSPTQGSWRGLPRILHRQYRPSHPDTSPKTQKRRTP